MTFLRIHTLSLSLSFYGNGLPSEYDLIPLVYLMFPFRPSCRAAARPPRVAPITATMIAIEVCGIQWGAFTQPNARAGFPECALAARPPAAHLELSALSEYIQDGSVPSASVTHSAGRTSQSVLAMSVRPTLPRSLARAGAQLYILPNTCT